MTRSRSKRLRRRAAHGTAAARRAVHFGMLSALLSAAAVAIAVVGCTLPPFDLDISLAHRAASHMKLEAETGPVRLYIGEIGDTDHYFVPSAAHGMDVGFLVTAGESAIRVRYIGRNSSGDPQRFFNTIDQFTDNSDGGVFNYRLVPLKVSSTVTAEFALFVLQSGDPEYDVYTWSSSDPNAEVTSIAPDPAPAPWVQAGHIAGYTVPGSDPAQTLHSRLSFDAGTGSYNEETYPFNENGPGAATFTRSGVALPGTPQRGFYLRHPGSSANLAYFSTPDGSKHALYRWDDSLSVERLRDTALPVHAVLSSGELYSRGGSSDILYDSEGKKKFDIATGNLTFVGERYINGVPRLIYTQTFWDKSEAEDAFYVRVYSIRAADLDKLKRE